MPKVSSRDLGRRNEEDDWAHAGYLDDLVEQGKGQYPLRIVAAALEPRTERPPTCFQRSLSTFLILSI